MGIDQEGTIFCCLLKQIKRLKKISPQLKEIRLLLNNIINSQGFSKLTEKIIMVAKRITLDYYIDNVNFLHMFDIMRSIGNITELKKIKTFSVKEKTERCRTSCWSQQVVCAKAI